MKIIFLQLFFGVIVTAQYGDVDNLKREESDMIVTKLETMQNSNKIIGERKVTAKFFTIETDTKFTNLKQDNYGLLFKMMSHKNSTAMEQISIDNAKETSNLPTETTTEKLDTTTEKLDTTTFPPIMPLNEKQADYYTYKVSESSKSESIETKYDYFFSQVAIYSLPINKESLPTCAGSLISNKYVLTTANCVEKEKSVVLVLGGGNIQESEPFQIKMECSDFIIHKKWDLNKLRNNIALIKLPQSVKFNEYTSPITLPFRADENRTYIGFNGTLVGCSSDYDLVANPVQATDVIISNFKCYLTYRSYISTSHICLSGQNMNSSCIGENGDPLIVEDVDGIVKLVGLLSFGMEDGCDNNHPVVFTRVTSYLSWIYNNMEDKK